MARGRNLVEIQEPLPGIHPGKLCRVHVPVNGRKGWVKCAKCPTLIRVPKTGTKARPRVAA